MNNLQILDRLIKNNITDIVDAYQQGREDQKKADNEFFNFEGAWELEKQKIRADAIDEIIPKVIDLLIDADVVSEKNRITDTNWLREQLKEQK